MEIRGYLRLLRRRWFVVVGLAVAGLIGAIGVTLTATPVYQAKTEAFISLHDGTSVADAYQGGQFSMQRVKSYAQVVTSPAVTGPVVAELRLDLTPEQLARRITANAPLDTVLIDIAVKDPSPERAQQIATAVGTTFSAVVAQLEAPNDKVASPVTVTIVRPAALPTTPVSPRRAVNLTLGLLIGLALGVGVAMLRESLDTSVKSDTDLAELTGSAALGVVGFDREAAKQPLVSLKETRSPRAEHYRSLRTNLRYADVDTPPRVVVVTSSVSLEGKSVTACNLALSLAGAGARTVLLEGDLRRPSVADYLGLEGAVGVTDVLVGRVQLADALQPWGDAGLPLQVLPSGALPPNPSELLGSANMLQLLTQLRERADFVIVDAPPLLAVTDAAILTKAADGALLVVRHGKTPRDQVRRALDALGNVDAKVLGTVLNMVPVTGHSGGRYGHYGYGYHAVTAPEPRAASSADQPV
ncbi:MAG: polysaccharide biosynthesis tyrosine autokinase [Actinobacteria bacterium]|nr:polysaccharide biosynthesis tyrosine autokinase [Actinomycetota bacterium]